MSLNFHLIVSTASCGKFFKAALTLSMLQNSFLIDQWNHLNCGWSLLSNFQTYHFWLSLLYHLEKLWCSWHRHYIWKMNLPLTFLWFSSISCKPSGCSFSKRLSYCQHFCNKYCMAILQDLTWLTNCFLQKSFVLLQASAWGIGSHMHASAHA